VIIVTKNLIHKKPPTRWFWKKRGWLMLHSLHRRWYLFTLHYARHKYSLQERVTKFRNTVKTNIKRFVIPTKPFVKIGITKIFSYNNKIFSSVNKSFGCGNKKILVVPNFVAITKLFFPWTHALGMRIKQKSVIWLFLKVPLWITISMESSQRDLFIDKVVEGFILKNNQIATPLPFHLHT